NTCTPTGTTDTGAVPVAVTTGDFNRDGKLDVVVVNGDADSVTTVLGDGQGRFTNAHEYGVDPAPVGAVAVDLDGDQCDDLAVLSDGTVYLLKSNCDGTFVPFPTASVATGGQGGFAIAAGKFR